MALRIFNTLSRRKEDFVPVVPGEARVYVCGVTVYDLCHIGHARSAIVFDIIRRYLRFRGFAVTFVKNYTDVDDKIIQRANEEGVTASAVSERYIAEYQTDMASIGVAAGRQGAQGDRAHSADDHADPAADRARGRLRAGGRRLLRGAPLSPPTGSSRERTWTSSNRVPGST
jgi:hypothetical protein